MLSNKEQRGNIEINLLIVFKLFKVVDDHIFKKLVNSENVLIFFKIIALGSRLQNIGTDTP